MTASQSGSAPLSFGIFDQVEWEDRPAGEVFEEHLRLVEYADDAGFYCYHVSEHHGTSLSLDTSPGILLAAASQRTKRIRLGPLVLAESGANNCTLDDATTRYLVCNPRSSQN